MISTIRKKSRDLTSCRKKDKRNKNVEARKLFKSLQMNIPLISISKNTQESKKNRSIKTASLSKNLKTGNYKIFKKSLEAPFFQFKFFDFIFKDQKK